MSPVGFENYTTTKKIVDLIRRTVKQEIDKERPAPAYGTVTSVDVVNRQVFVQFPGEESPIGIAMSSPFTALVGHIVRVEGVTGDRYVSDIIATVGDDEEPVPVEPVRNWKFYSDDIFDITVGGTQVKILTYEPDPYSLHVEVRGVTARKYVEWTIDGDVLTLTPALDLRAGDVLYTEYVYDASQQPITVSFPYLTYDETILQDVPVAYYHMDEADSSLLDSSGHSRHAISLSGSPLDVTRRTSSLLPSQWNLYGTTFGWSSYGGNPQIFTLDNSDGGFNTPEFYFEGWFDRGASGSICFYQHDGRIRLVIAGGCGQIWVWDTGTANWVLVGATDNSFCPGPRTKFLGYGFNGSQFVFHQNGAVYLTGAFSHALPSSSSNPKIGTHDGNDPTGGMDEVAIFGSMLPDARAAAHYLAGSRWRTKSAYGTFLQPDMPYNIDAGDLGVMFIGADVANTVTPNGWTVRGTADVTHVASTGTYTYRLTCLTKTFIGSGGDAMPAIANVSSNQNVFSSLIRKGGGSITDVQSQTTADDTAGPAPAVSSGVEVVKGWLSESVLGTVTKPPGRPVFGEVPGTGGTDLDVVSVVERGTAASSAFNTASAGWAAISLGVI